MNPAGLACVTRGTGLSENIEAVKSRVPQQVRGEMIPKPEHPEEHRASDVHTRALDEADGVYDPAEFAEVDDEL